MGPLTSGQYEGGTQLLVTYVELHCHSAYSFLDGASHPEELAARREPGYEALALDHDGVYGSLEFAHAAKLAGIRPITGAEDPRRRRLAGAARVEVAGFAGTGAGRGGAHVTLLCETGEGYANLCRILTAAHAGTRRAGRDDREPLPPAVPLETAVELNEGLVCLSGCARNGLRCATRTASPGWRPRSAGSGSTSSCNDRTSGATRRHARAP